MRRTMLCLSIVLVLPAAFGAERKPADRAPDKSSNDLDLNGVWRGFVVDGKGERPDRGPVHLELTVKGNQITAQRLNAPGGSLGQGSYTIATGRYYMMDATEAKGRGRPKVYEGIVQFGPDLMRWCVATPGNKRPTNFETKGQQFLLVLKRQQNK